MPEENNLHKIVCRFEFESGYDVLKKLCQIVGKEEILKALNEIEEDDKDEISSHEKQRL